jgi:hypothetical protein
MIETLEPQKFSKGIYFLEVCQPINIGDFLVLTNFG